MSMVRLVMGMMRNEIMHDLNVMCGLMFVRVNEDGMMRSTGEIVR